MIVHFYSLPSVSMSNQAAIHCDHAHQGTRLGGAEGDLVAGAQRTSGDPRDEGGLLLETKLVEIDEICSEIVDLTLSPYV